MGEGGGGVVFQLLIMKSCLKILKSDTSIFHL